MLRRPAARPEFEELEQRLLYSADFAPAALANFSFSAGTEPHSLQQLLAPQAAHATAEIAFVDMSLPDAESLVKDLQSQREAGRPIEVVRIESNEDGIARITAALDGRSDITAVHVLSHGADGVLQLGSVKLDTATLLNRAGELAHWSGALTQDADLLLYGCDVAASARGQQLVESLAALTGADVAASSDLTGAFALGGNWSLEFDTGRIEVGSAVTQAFQQSWSGLLLAPTNEIRVNTNTSSDQTTTAENRGSQQAVALDAAGNYVVVWSSNSQDGAGYGVYARRFDATGTALTGEILVNSTTNNDQKWARVASDAAGNFVVTWTSENQDGTATSVYARRFDANGNALTAETRVNTTATGAQTDPMIGMNAGNGDYVIVWEGEGPGDTAGIFFRRYFADGTAKDAVDQLANQTNGGTESNPAVTMAPNGNFVIAWEVGNKVYFQRFDASGGALNSRVQIDNFLSTSSGIAIASDAAGNFTVVYREANILPGVWCKGYNADGSVKYTWFQPDTGDASNPSIDMAADGAFVVVYDKSGDGSGAGVYARKYNADGTAAGVAFQVNQTTSGPQANASVALLDTNNFVVTWSGTGPGDSNGVFARQFGVANTAPVMTLPASASVVQDSLLGFTAGNTISISDAEAGSQPVRMDLSATHGVLYLGATIGPEFQVNTTTASNQQAPRIAVAADGHYVVTWQSNNQDGSKFGVYARVYNADGSARTGEIAVNTTTNDQQSDPSIAIDGSGRFVIAWQSYDTAKLTYDIYARSFNADGSALSGQKRITTDADDQTLAAVSMDAAGNVVIAYQSKGQDSGATLGIYARTANAALSTINAETRVNTTVALDQAAPRVAASDSGFVVVWQSAGQDGSGIYGQRYTTAGAKVGSEFLVNANTAGDQTTPAVAMMADGRFVVAWESKGQDNADGKLGVYARRFAADGTALGSEFIVNTTTLGDQSTPRVAIAADGRFVVGWTSKGQDNADGKEGAYAQGFAADGTQLGAEFRLNTQTADVQSMPSIGLRADGGLLAVWQSNNQDGNGYGVFGQRFLAPGAITFVSGDGVADTSMSITGAQADINVALQTLRYTPDAGYWGPASLTVTTDDLGAGSGAPMSTTGVLPIQVLKIDVGPVNTVPAAQTVAEDTPIVFSNANGNAITVADVDADPLPVQVSLSVGQGTLRLASTTGLTVVGGADGTASVVVQGRLADLNAALDGLAYAPALNYNGSDTLTLSTNDLGHSDVGGPYTATSTVGITINAVNDVPVIQLPAVAAMPEGTALVLSTANGNALSIADPDAGSGNIEVTLASTYGDLKLARTNNLSFIVGDGKGGEQRITFRGTLANVNLALDGLQFTPRNGYAGPAWLEVATNDLGNSGTGGALADRAVLEITVQPDANNARPIITLPPNQTTVEETPLLLSAAGGNAITVLDDAGGLPLQVTLTATGGTLTLGTATGGEFQVATAVASDQQAPAVAMTPGGAHVVVWQSNNQDGSSQGIYLQRYTEEGFALGPEQRVNTTTAGAQTAPAVWAADNGSFVVVWTSDGQDGGGGGGTGVFGQRFDAAGVPLGGEFRINSTLAGDQEAPAVAGDAAGNFVVVWQSKGQDGDGWGVYGQRFSAAGIALGGEFEINTTTAKDQSAPVVAMSASGSFVVAWQGVRPGGSDFNIYAQRFDAAGVAAGAEFRVATITYKDQIAPAIAADDAGNFVIAWQSQDIDYNDGKFGIYAQRYAANGSPLGAEFLVNTTTPNEQAAPALAMDGSGSFVVAWQAKNQDSADNKEGIYAQRYDAAGVRAGGEFKINSTVADAQTAPALAMSDNGRLTAVWTSNGQDGSGLGVFGQRFIDTRSLAFSVGDGTGDATMTFTGTLQQINDVLDGLVFTPATDFDGKALLDITVNDLGHSGSGGAKVAAGTLQINVLPVNDAPVVTLPPPPTFVEDAPIVFSATAGRAITIADADAGNKKLLVTLTAPVGTLTLGALNGLQFTTGDGTDDATMTFNGTLVQLNNVLDGLRLVLPAHYTGSAAVNVTVNDQGNTGTGGALGTSATLPITVLPDASNSAPLVAVPGPQRTSVDTPLVLSANTTGAVTVVDDAGNTPIRVSVTVTNGTVTLSSRVDAEATIDRTTTAGRQQEPRIAMLPNGDHIVVWTSDFAASGTTGVVGQRFDAAGARVGPEFLVNTTVAGNQWAPAIAANGSGAFAVAWVSDNQDGSGRGIYLQRFDAQGQPLGVETRVNTTITGDQLAPAVAIDASGAVVVAWTSADVNGLGVFAQRFDAKGEPAGGEFQVNITLLGDQEAPAVAMDATGNFVVAWQGQDADKEGILVRRFDAAGNPLGGEFVVNTVTVGSQLTPAVAMNASGAWVVGWQSGSGGSSGEIFGQRFDAAGVAVGGNFQANTTTANPQTVPTVAINDSGDFAFAWQSKDGDGQGIFGQAFVADGTPIGREQQVNTTTLGNQVAPSIGIAADGTYRVVWTGDNQDGANTGVAGQRMLRGDELVFLSGDGVDDASFTFDATLANLNAALDGLRFTPTAGFVGVAKVQVSVDDLGASGSGGARVGSGSVNIVVGNAPLVDLDADDSAGAAGADFRVNFRTGLGPVPLADADASVTDPNNANLQSLTVRIQNPADGAAEVLAANTNGTPIIATYNSGTATLTLTGNTTLANYQKVLRTVTYNNTAATPTPTSRSVTFVAFDGTGNSNVATATVSFNGGVDSPPVAGNDVFATVEDQTLMVGPGGVLANDADPDLDAVSAVLVSGPSFGTLASFGSDGSFTYLPAAGFNGVDTFTYRATAGGLDSGVATVQIVVSAVNDAPRGADATRTIDEDQSYVFALVDFGFADPDDTPPDGLLGVRIATLPASGTLSVGGAAVNAGDVVAVSDINAGRLIFTPAPDANGLGYAQIGFQVRDDGGTANGGADTDPVVRVVTFNVNPVNDAPTLAFVLADQTATQDVAFSFAVPAGSFADIDGAATLGYSATLASGAALPAWLSFDAATQTFSGTPGNGDVGAISVRVTASDASNASVFDDFVLTVANVNDPPVITSDGGGATAARSVSENSTAVTTVAATDVDGTVPSYAITGGADAARFTINATTGALAFAVGPNFEAPTDANGDNVYVVAVSASDGVNSDTQTVSVTVTNVNEAPTITSDGGGASAAVSIAENTTAVTAVSATDVDLPAQTFTYSISGGADAAKFAINASTGVLSFIAVPDYESPTDAGGDNVYDVIVQVSDGMLTDLQAIAVTVTPVNDNNPVITSDGGGATAAVSIAENTTAVTTVTAADADLPAQTLTFSISGGADAAKFMINASTGVLSFIAAPDYEAPTDVGANNVYDVIVQVSDGTLTDTQAIAVAVTPVNDNTPSITSNGGGASAAASVAENTTAVTTVTATDADLPVQTLTYSISGGADAAKFAINASTGVLSFIAAPDYEAPADVGASNVYDVIVQVSDGTLTDLQAIAVTVTPVNDSNPVITSNGGAATSAVSVVENSTAVTPVTATDADLPAQTLTYSISGGADAAKFTINATTGVLSFIAAPNYEAPTDAGANNVYDVIVQVSDGTLTDTQAIAVTVTPVNDNNPVITSNGGGASAAVNVAANGTAVTTVTAVDADLPAQTLVYSIVGGADAAKFVIDAGTGVLGFVVAPTYGAPADADADNVYDVTVQVNDGTLSDSQAIAVAVFDDYAPVITSDGGGVAATVGVSENTTAVTTVSATDADLPAQMLTYSISGGADAAKFTINATTGGLSFIAAPDYEAPADVGANNVYDVIVQVSDGTLTDSQAVAVSVGNVDDNAPLITANSLTISEGGTATPVIASIDPDNSAAPLTYTVSGWSGGRLELTSAPGVAVSTFTQADVDAGLLRFVSDGGEAAPAYQLRVSDGVFSTGPQAASVSFTNVNDAPVITSDGGGPSANLVIAENAAQVTTVTAADPDAASDLRFAISGGADAALFAIDPVTGALRFISAPNHELPTDANANNTYEVIVSVSDGSLSAQQMLFVDVANVDEAPTITTNSLVLSTNGATVILLGTDPDTAAAALNYQVSGLVGGHFEMVATPGLAVGGFSQAEVNAGAVRFVEDGSGATPNYVLTLTDGVSTVTSGAPDVVLASVPAPAPVPDTTPVPAAATAPVPSSDAAPSLAAKDVAATGSVVPDLAPTREGSLSTKLLPDMPAPALGWIPAPAPAPVAMAGPIEVPSPRNSSQATQAPLEFALPSEGTVAHGKVALEGDVAAALRERGLAQELDRLRNTVAEFQQSDKEVIASSAMVSAGLSVGYVLWLARGGVLVASLMSALPAWAMVDPMPVLAQMKRRDGEQDGEEDDNDDEANDPIERLFSKARSIMKREGEPTLPASAVTAAQQSAPKEQRA